MTYQKKWKFLRDVDGEIKSQSGDHTWEIGKWYTEGSVSLCHRGFHSSDKIRQALSYVKGEYLARVEVRGERVSSTDKNVHESMRLAVVYRWTKQDSVGLAVFAARLVLKVYEDKHPTDLRPRKAVEAAEKWLENPDAYANAAIATAANAARTAAIATAANAARTAAYATAYAATAATAYATANDANDANAAAANAARTAAFAAAAAAFAAGAYAYADAANAARKDTVNQIERWLVARVATLEKV